ncbi:MAG: 50S ribosomal protein L25 [Bacteroidetes bacterium]|nr:50S ribosomal protein L25 [Bacteroidota bacterium]
MKKVQLSGSTRSNVGKKDAKALRVAGLVPCVLYGQGVQTHFSVKIIDIERIVYSPDVYQVEIDIDGKKTTAIIQELQQHPVKDLIRHVDFLELDAKKPVKVGLPVRLTGSSRGVLNGGRLLQVFRRLNVMALPGDLPEAIVVDITAVRIGQAIRIKDIANSKLTFLDPNNAVIVSVSRARGSVDDSDDDDEETTPEAAAEATEAAAE